MRNLIIITIALITLTACGQSSEPTDQPEPDQFPAECVSIWNKRIKTEERTVTYDAEDILLDREYGEAQFDFDSPLEEPIREGESTLYPIDRDGTFYLLTIEEDHFSKATVNHLNQGSVGGRIPSVPVIMLNPAPRDFEIDRGDLAIRVYPDQEYLDYIGNDGIQAEIKMVQYQGYYKVHNECL